MKNKKRKGSALVSILAITIILLTLGSIIITSVINTTKSNAKSNNKKDLQYAAESGIEIARGYFMGPEGKDGVIDTISNISDRQLVKSLEQGIVGKVSLTSSYAKNDDGTEDRSRIIVKSEAFHSDDNNKSEVVRMRLRKSQKGNGLEIFDYGLIAGQGNLTIENSGSNSVNSSIIAGGSIMPTDIDVKEGHEKKENSTFSTVEFPNKNKLKKVKIKDFANGYPLDHGIHYGLLAEIDGKFEKADVLELTMEDFKENKFKVVNGSIEEGIENIQDFKNKELKNIVKLNVGKATNGRPLKLFFINAEEIEFELGTALDLNNVMIITNAKIKIRGNTSLTLNNSTMIGESIHAAFETAFFINEESGNKNPNGDVDNKENGIFYVNRERILEVIECFTNGISGSSSSTGEGFIPEDENPYS